ncbi:MAG: hypothetical protein V7637_972 [Mycobacteriales bacterium]|jgi:hypothetical protein
MSGAESGRSGLSATWLLAIATLIGAIVGSGGLLGILSVHNGPSSAGAPASSSPPAAAHAATGRPPGAASAPPAVPPGRKLGHYAVDLSDGYTLRFTASNQRPRPVECCPGDADVTFFSSGGQFTSNYQLALYDGAATYQACRDDTRYTSNITYFTDITGQTVCFTGRHLIVAARITKIVGRLSVLPGSYVSLDVTVWQG